MGLCEAHWELGANQEFFEEKSGYMGVLDRVLKKEPTEDELQAKEDLMMKSSEEKYQEEAGGGTQQEAPRQIFQSPDRAFVQLEKDIELLKVQMELMKQQKQVSDEKFARFSEQIGEIRATVLDSERDAATIKMQAEKSIELIQMVQPERLMQNVRKLEARVEEGTALEEKYNAMQQKIVGELKDLRQKTEAIRGAETIMRLNEEVKSELSTAMQVQAKMEQKADKVEAIYADFQQHFYEYQKVFDRLKELEGEFRDVSKEFNIFKVKIESAASKNDFLKLKNDLKEYGTELDGKIIEIDKEIAKTEMLKSDVLQETDEKLVAAKAEILKKITSAEEAADSIRRLGIELKKSILDESSQMSKALLGRITSLEEEAEEMKKGSKRLADVETLASGLPALKSEVERSRKAVDALEVKMKDLSGINADMEKAGKTLEALGDEFKQLALKGSETEKRLRSVEVKSEDIVNRANRKLDGVVSDVSDNTAVLRDVVKEVYSLKTHSANILTKNDLNSLQKSINEKLISFDMSLLKLEHRITDYESEIREFRREISQVQKDVRERLRDIGLLKEINFGKERKDIA